MVEIENRFDWLPSLLKYAHKLEAVNKPNTREIENDTQKRESMISSESIRNMIIRSKKSTLAPTYLSRHTHLLGPMSISKKGKHKISNETGRPTIQKQHHSRVIMESKPGLKKNATLHNRPQKKKWGGNSSLKTSFKRADTVHEQHTRYSHGHPESPTTVGIKEECRKTS